MVFQQRPDVQLLAVLLSSVTFGSVGGGAYFALRGKAAFASRDLSDELCADILHRQAVPCGKLCRGQPVGTPATSITDGGGMTADAMAIRPVLALKSPAS